MRRMACGSSLISWAAQDRNEEELKDKVSNGLNLRFEFAVKATAGDNGMGPRTTGVSQIDHGKVTKALLQDDAVT